MHTDQRMQASPQTLLRRTPVLTGLQPLVRTFF